MRRIYSLGLLLLPFFCYSQTPTITARHVIAGNCTAVTYGNGVYVASSSGTFTSTDARTWSLLNDSVPSFAFLAYGNGVFVGIAGTSIYSSSNGTTWTYRANAGDIESGLYFANGAFYALGQNADAVKSTDGINWAALNLGNSFPTPARLSGFGYNGFVYVIGVTVAGSRFDPAGSAGVLYSTTGASGSWTFAAANAAPPVSNLAWVKDRFYLFAQDGIYNSTDGVNWGLPSPALMDTLPDGTVGAAGGNWVFAVSDSIYLIGGSSLELSTDGTHFKSLAAPTMQSMGGAPLNGLPLIYGIGGIATATDGIHFKLDGTLFSALASNGSGYVAAGLAGYGGPLFQSPDFVTWTQQPPQAASIVLYNGSKYVATGSGNTGLSTDGLTWTDTRVANSFTAMDFGAGRYVAGTFYSLLTSPDAINWSEADTSYSYYYKVRYLNNQFFALGMNFRTNTGKILQSADGIHWQNITPQLDTVVTYYNDVMYDGTKYYFVGLRHWTDLFTISTTDPMNTSSYGAMGSIANPAAGTSAADYSPQFDDFIFHKGQFVGTVVNGGNGQTYLAYATDGMNWTTTALGGSGHARTIVADTDVYYIAGYDGGYYTVSFAQGAPPVLLRFEARPLPSRSGEDSRLNWEMKNDSGIAYFLVQHSMDSARWDSIGVVNAEKRTAKEEKDDKKWRTERYQFIHETPPVGLNFYRLGITDGQRHRWWSPVRQVNIRNKDITLYPNPARDVLHVQLPESGKSRLIIFNHAWLPVGERKGNGNNVTIDLRSLPAGVYYLQVFQEGMRYSKEFMIAE